MKQLKFALFVSALSLFAPACTAPPATNQTANLSTRPAGAATPAAEASAAATPDELASARADYARFCVRCHKEDGTGGPFELEDGTKLKVADLREGHSTTHSDEKLARAISNGDDGMPAFKGKLEPERIEALVGFIRRDFQGRGAGAAGAPAAAPAPPAPAH